MNGQGSGPLFKAQSDAIACDPLELPDVFHRVELGGFRRQRDDNDVGRHTTIVRAVAGMADAHTLHAIEVTQKRLCWPPTSRPQVFQAFLHGKDQDQPKYASPDRGVGAMEDRPRPYHRLGLQEQVLDLKQVTVSRDRLQTAGFSRSCARRGYCRSAPPARVCRHRFRRPACPSSRASCADSGGRPSCRR